ncbi:lysine demethylase 3 isoform X2 [Brevipalpus obovatus]|uniref:lysine demethylase 3 isoform X2 n=2 Tax=Brevipalpus obovatus TaxID=246614 RepID=UPI003D9E3BB8
MAQKWREEVIGKRFLSVSYPSTTRLKAKKISEWPWRQGVIRASNKSSPQHPELTVLVEYDDVDWRKREWIHVYDQQFQVFLIEQSIIWTVRKEEGSQGLEKDWLALNFKPLVDKVSVQQSPLQPIEFFDDKQLNFVDIDQLKLYEEGDLNKPAYRSAATTFAKHIRQWKEYQDSQKILLTTPSVLVGYRVKVYRSEGTTQWYTAVIVSYNEKTKLLTLTDDTVLEERNEDPTLVQMKLIGDGVVESILTGEEVGITPRRRLCNNNNNNNNSNSNSNNNTNTNNSNNQNSRENKKPSSNQNRVKAILSNSTSNNSQAPTTVNITNSSSTPSTTVNNSSCIKSNFNKETKNVSTTVDSSSSIISSSNANSRNNSSNSIISEQTRDECEINSKVKIRQLDDNNINSSVMHSTETNKTSIIDPSETRHQAPSEGQQNLSEPQLQPHQQQPGAHNRSPNSSSSNSSSNSSVVVSNKSAQSTSANSVPHNSPPNQSTAPTSQATQQQPSSSNLIHNPQIGESSSQKKGSTTTANGDNQQRIQNKSNTKSPTTQATQSVPTSSSMMHLQMPLMKTPSLGSHGSNASGGHGVSVSSANGHGHHPSGSSSSSGGSNRDRGDRGDPGNNSGDNNNNNNRNTVTATSIPYRPPPMLGHQHPSIPPGYASQLVAHQAEMMWPSKYSNHMRPSSSASHNWMMMTHMHDSRLASHDKEREKISLEMEERERKERERQRQAAQERERNEKERNEKERRREEEEREKKHQATAQAVQQHFEESLKSYTKMPYVQPRFYPHSGSPLSNAHPGSKPPPLLMSHYENNNRSSGGNNYPNTSSSSSTSSSIHSNNNNGKNGSSSGESSSKKPNPSPVSRVDTNHGQMKLGHQRANNEALSMGNGAIPASGMAAYNSYHHQQKVAYQQQSSSVHAGFTRPPGFKESSSSSPPNALSNSTVNCSSSDIHRSGSMKISSNSAHSSSSSLMSGNSNRTENNSLTGHHSNRNKFSPLPPSVISNSRPPSGHLNAPSPQPPPRLPLPAHFSDKRETSPLVDRSGTPISRNSTPIGRPPSLSPKHLGSQKTAAHQYSSERISPMYPVAVAHQTHSTASLVSIQGPPAAHQSSSPGLVTSRSNTPQITSSTSVPQASSLNPLSSVSMPNLNYFSQDQPQNLVKSEAKSRTSSNNNNSGSQQQPHHHQSVSSSPSSSSSNSSSHSSSLVNSHSSSVNSSPYMPHPYHKGLPSSYEPKPAHGSLPVPLLSKHPHESKHSISSNSGRSSATSNSGNSSRSSSSGMSHGSSSDRSSHVVISSCSTSSAASSSSSTAPSSIFNHSVIDTGKAPFNLIPPPGLLGHGGIFPVTSIPQNFIKSTSPPRLPYSSGVLQPSQLPPSTSHDLNRLGHMRSTNISSSPSMAYTTSMLTSDSLNKMIDPKSFHNSVPKSGLYSINGLSTGDKRNDFRNVGGHHMGSNSNVINPELHSAHHPPPPTLHHPYVLSRNGHSQISSSPTSISAVLSSSSSSASSQATNTASSKQHLHLQPPPGLNPSSEASRILCGHLPSGLMSARLPDSGIPYGSYVPGTNMSIGLSPSLSMVGGGLLPPSSVSMSITNDGRRIPPPPSLSSSTSSRDMSQPLNFDAHYLAGKRGLPPHFVPLTSTREAYDPVKKLKKENSPSREDPMLRLGPGSAVNMMNDRNVSVKVEPIELRNPVSNHINIGGERGNIGDISSLVSKQRSSPQMNLVKEEKSMDTLGASDLHHRPSPSFNPLQHQISPHHPYLQQQQSHHPSIISHENVVNKRILSGADPCCDSESKTSVTNSAFKSPVTSEHLKVVTLSNSIPTLSTSISPPTSSSAPPPSTSPAYPLVISSTPSTTTILPPTMSTSSNSNESSSTSKFHPKLKKAWLQRHTNEDEDKIESNSKQLQPQQQQSANNFTSISATSVNTIVKDVEKEDIKSDLSSVSQQETPRVSSRDKHQSSKHQNTRAGTPSASDTVGDDEHDETTNNPTTNTNTTPTSGSGGKRRRVNREEKGRKKSKKVEPSEDEDGEETSSFSDSEISAFTNSGSKTSVTEKVRTSTRTPLKKRLTSAAGKESSKSRHNRSSDDNSGSGNERKDLREDREKRRRVKESRIGLRRGRKPNNLRGKDKEAKDSSSRESSTTTSVKKCSNRSSASSTSSSSSTSSLAEKPSTAVLKKTGQPFLQGSCFDLAKTAPKCRECKIAKPNQRNKSNVSNSHKFCRFYDFRKLKYNKSGCLVILGFSEPKDASEKDSKIWLPPEKPCRDLTIDVSKFLLRHVGDQFCDLVQQEKRAKMLHMNKDKTITWKRVVQGVREMCDVCETTLFNIHWVCHKCGFVICIDCYEARSSGKLKGEDNPPRDRDEYQWLLCTNRQPHGQDKLMMTQIITSTALNDVDRMLHTVRKNFGIPSNCKCVDIENALNSGDESDKTNNSNDGDLNSDSASNSISTGKHHKGNNHPNGANKEAANRALANGILPPSENNTLTGFSSESGASPLSWLADVALSSRKITPDELSKDGNSNTASTSVTGKTNLSTGKDSASGGKSEKNTDVNSSEKNATESDDKESNFSTLRELLIKPNSAKNDKDDENNDDIKQQSKTLSDMDDDTNSHDGLSIDVDDAGDEEEDEEMEKEKETSNESPPSTIKKAISSSNSSISSVATKNSSSAKGTTKNSQKEVSPSPQRFNPARHSTNLESRVCKLDGTRELYPKISHSWESSGRLCVFHEPASKNNLDLFQEQWKRGQPVIFSGLEKLLDSDFWRPDEFSKNYGDSKNDIVNCKTGHFQSKMPMRKFWDGFENLNKRLKGDDGESLILKLKDWPTSDDFSEVLPKHYNDLMEALPMQEYTRRDGALNLAARLPDCFVRPDLGPKMYNAYGQPSWYEKGTTNLHVDVSDAVNVMVYVGIPKSNSKTDDISEAVNAALEEGECDEIMLKRCREKGTKIGALWHIYEARDADAIRQLLHKVSLERGQNPWNPHQDMIHDQSWYLSRELRERLRSEYGVEGYAIVQCLGDAIFIPAGAPHQVRNLNSCIKVANDFVSPENVHHCFNLTQQFRSLSDNHNNHEDKLQIKNIIYHTVKDALASLKNATPSAATPSVSSSTTTTSSTTSGK